MYVNCFFKNPDISFGFDSLNLNAYCDSRFVVLYNLLSKLQEIAFIKDLKLRLQALYYDLRLMIFRSYNPVVEHCILYYVDVTDSCTLILKQNLE